MKIPGLNAETLLRLGETLVILPRLPMVNLGHSSAHLFTFVTQNFGIGVLGHRHMS
jgi:hypothetical protein